MANQLALSQDGDLEGGGPQLDPVIRKAKKRFKRCEDWENDARLRFIEDIKFANGDATNGYQWPNDIQRRRDVDDRPCLTLNKVNQHNLMIINDAKQNKPSVAVRPVGGVASFQAAQVIEGLVRHIEYQSNAQSAYDIASTFQVEGGIGYWRITTDYAGDDTMDQEIFIRPIRDPLTVYIDPDAKEMDKSDAEFAFIFDDMSKEDFEESYPEFKDKGTRSALGAADDWIDKDHVRVAEYFVKVDEEDSLVSYVHEGKRQTSRKSKIGDKLYKKLVDDPQTHYRTTKLTKIKWYLIIGEEVAEEGEWPGRYIPIVPLIGKETIINGELDRKGHTRTMLDAQRMYNYWSSSATEHVALQSKTPYVGPAEAFEEYEEYWKTANTVNHAFLPYQGYNEAGEKLDPPQRQQPPTMAQAYLEGMQVAQMEMMMVSGQYQAQMGEQGNERSGKAIEERQRQGDNATYHFIDNLAIAIRFTGKIIIDLIPHVYDTKRTMQILTEDGSDMEVEFDPQAKQAYQQHQQEVNAAVKRVFNPSMGKYEVEADIGPAYATRRQEAFNALIQIITQAPNLVGIIGDILLKEADFPSADEAAQRLKRMVPPQALGTGPSPEVAQLQQQLQKLTGLYTKAIETISMNKIALKGKEEMREIDAYNAETQRLKVLMPEGTDTSGEATGIADIVKQAIQDTLGTDVSGVAGGAASTAAQQAGPTDPAQASPGAGTTGPLGAPLQHPQVPGAQMATDGKWYMPDHARPGHYLWMTKG